MIKNQSDEIKSYLISHVGNHADDLVAHTSQHFGVSRTTVHRHLNSLIKVGKVIKTGVTKQVRYALADGLRHEATFSINQQFDEFDIFAQHIKTMLAQYANSNAFHIAEYAVTEMLNNCHDHSRGKKVGLIVQVHDKYIEFIVSDDGIGLFEKLRTFLNINDTREIMFELTKGKVTTDTENHTGEGIFFTARATDYFVIEANGFCYERDNLLEDWSFYETAVHSGTTVKFTIERDTERSLVKMFKQYQGGEEGLDFCKTDVTVELSQLQGERLISRSQAKRVSRNLDQFASVMLDFKGVQAIGQGFADQLFRVYQATRPDFTICYKNASDDIDFMIKRSLNNSA